MKLKLLCDAIGVECPVWGCNLEISGIAVDSRRVTEGCMFICIRGLHTDSHTYIGDAIAAGAVCILTEDGAEYETAEGVLFLTCKDTRAASAYLYDAWYGYPSKKLKMIGVTGTNGKTSVVQLLGRILSASLYRVGLIGTVGCESMGRCLEKDTQNELASMTTPDPPDLYRMLAEMVGDGVEYVLMEVTSHALALGKLAPIAFDVAIFTNLTPEHLDFHGSMEEYALAKASLFQKSKISVINQDSPYADQMIEAATGRVVTCGTLRTADYTAREIEFLGNAGVGYQMRSANTSIGIFCPIPGAFSVMNSMQAAITALQLGIGARAVKDALSTISGVRGRMERVRLGLGADFTVMIDYAHTPDALEGLLRTARQIRKRDGRLILLFGCGGDRDRGKRPMMGRIASDYADFVIVTSDNSRSEEPSAIISEILSGMDPEKPYTVIENRRDAIVYAIENAQKDDLILLAGKGHEEYEIDRLGKRRFSEREIVAEAFAKRQA